jgi:hypothetical protein
VLHHWQQLDMRETEVAHVLGQRRRDLAVGHRAVRLFGDAAPRAHVQLVDRYRRLQRLLTAAVGHPAAVLPGVVEIPDHRCGARRRLGPEGERVRLIDLVAVDVRLDVVLVNGAALEAGHEALPDAGRLARTQRVGAIAPVVEVADDADGRRVGRPYGEVNALFAIDGSQVRAEDLVEADAAALVEQVDVVVC